jgi:hypothetical protein
VDATPVVKDLKPITLGLDQLYLDPNNPRFVGPNWEYVVDDQIDTPANQDRSRKQLIAHHDVERLRESIEINGYLPIDCVVVREFKTKKFVVLEGNRRICAAKLIGSMTKTGERVNEAVLESLKAIPCQQYTGGQENAAWVFQGLRHISGIREWPAYNKARLLVEQMENNGLKLTEVGRRFGISPYSAGQWVRAYRTFEQARSEAEKADKVGQESFAFFQELFNRSCVALRDWMKWDDKTEKCAGTRLSEFVDWLYPDPENPDALPSIDGAELFERRRIGQAIELRQLAELISQSPEGFEQFRRGGDLQAAHAELTYREHIRELEANRDAAQELLEAMAACTRLLRDIPFRLIDDAEFADKLRKADRELRMAADRVLPRLTADVH